MAEQEKSGLFGRKISFQLGGASAKTSRPSSSSAGGRAPSPSSRRSDGGHAPSSSSRCNGDADQAPSPPSPCGRDAGLVPSLLHGALPTLPPRPFDSIPQAPSSSSAGGQAPSPSSRCRMDPGQAPSLLPGEPTLPGRPLPATPSDAAPRSSSSPPSPSSRCRRDPGQAPSLLPGGPTLPAPRPLPATSPSDSRPQITPKVAKHKSYRKPLSCAKQRFGIASGTVENSVSCCQLHTSSKHRLDQFLAKRKLSKIVAVPGTSNSYRVRIVAVLEIRLILRRSIRLLYKLHRNGHCLSGSFELSNFLIDEGLFMTLEYSAETGEDYSKTGGCGDLLRFVRMVEEDVFGSEDISEDISDWLSLIQRAGTDYEYLICYHSALMEHNQVLATFMQMYWKFEIMDLQDDAGYLFVLDHLKHFTGWGLEDLHNRHFWDSYKRENALYGRDVPSLLRLIRSTFQHIAKKTVCQGMITFGEEHYEYMLQDQFPKLLSEFMEAIYITGYLPDLNLEFVMV